MDDDREAFEFAYALYLARQVDREAAQMIVQAGAKQDCSRLRIGRTFGPPYTVLPT